jgi:hypothetical protein
MKNLILTWLFCLYASFAFGQQVAFDVAFGLAMNTGLYELNDHVSRLGFGSTIGLSARFGKPSGLYVKPALYYGFSHAMTKTDLQYTQGSGVALGFLRYTATQNTANLTCYVGYTQNKWSFEFAPVLTANLFTYFDYNDKSISGKMETRQVVLGVSTGFNYAAGERVMVGLCLNRGITDMFPYAGNYNRTVTMLLFKGSYLLKK